MSDRQTTTQLSNVDAYWLHIDDPVNPMVITVLWGFDQPIDFHQLRALVRERLLVFERFRQRIVFPRNDGRPHWELDPQFELGVHLHHIALPGAGTQADLRDLVSDLLSTTLDRARPLWQMYLVDRCGTGCALIMRLHHCLADGMALSNMLLALTDQGAERARAAAQAEHHGARSPLAAISEAARAAEHVLHEGWDLISHPDQLLKLAGLGLSGAGAAGKLLLMSPDPPTLLKSPLNVAKRAAWSGPVALADVKAAGKVNGATVNDTLLTAISGAVGRYLRERGTQVEGLTIRAVVPVNLLPPGVAPNGGNHFGLVFVQLPIGVADSVERAERIRAEMSAIKRSPEAVVALGLMGAMGAAPIEIERMGVDMFATKGSLVITNVPGPREPLSLAGHPIHRGMFWVPTARLGLGISILSYNGEVQLGILTDAGIIPDPERIVTAFHQEMDELIGLARQVNPVEG
ncbi:MAG: wax ester/triacylglycerol synthase family O-acyltransferase [Chloroflexi bacterium]|nr:wax ester/triacylglycerol synthase family O-acyltransferase [Chloroflexota bacterium]